MSFTMVGELDDFKLKNDQIVLPWIRLMRSLSTLTTTQAAGIAAVAPSTIKRWADQGLLPFTRTAGGHRRFERGAVERLLGDPRTGDTGDAGVVNGSGGSGSAQAAQVSALARPSPGARAAGALPPGDSSAPGWVRCLVAGRRHEIDGRLLEARSRHESWCAVADELAGALVEMGRQWERGQISIAQEHVASDALTRALGRIGDSFPVRLDGPRCLLACAGEDEHTLGLSLAELCVREAGWTPLWLGRRTPAAEVIRLVERGEVAVVALSAASTMNDAPALRALVDEVGAACKARGVGLLLGGSGRWPARPRHGTWIPSFARFRQLLVEQQR
jgi:excisionase family DNA binding protein